jgi:purine-nucleoside phosphorylase
LDFWLNPLVTTAVAKLKKLSRLRPALALVLGSGFQHALDELEVDARIAYARIPGFPPVGVSGHAGELFFGHLGGTPVLVLSGRAHFYEGHSMERVTFAVRTLAEFGIRDLLLTNAAGGINRKFRPGDFMILTDHINLMGVNPLRPSESDPSSLQKALQNVAAGASQPLPRFVDLTRVYDL